MWQFAEAVRGLADGCQELGIPVTGGNVSFYNQTGAAAIHPTPVVGVLGVLDDVGRPGADGLHAHDGDADLPARRDPRGAVRLRVGLGDARAPRRRAAGGRPGRASRRSPSVLAEAARVGPPRAPRTTSPTAGWRRRWSSRACGTASAPRSRCRRTALDPFVVLFTESAGRALVAGAARAREGVHRAVRRARRAVARRSAWSTAQTARSTCAASSRIAARRAARGVHRRRCRRCSAVRPRWWPSPSTTSPRPMTRRPDDAPVADDAPAAERRAGRRVPRRGRVRATTSPCRRMPSRSRRVSRRSTPSWPRPPRATTPPEDGPEPGGADPGGRGRRDRRRARDVLRRGRGRRRDRSGTGPAGFLPTGPTKN